MHRRNTLVCILSAVGLLAAAAGAGEISGTVADVRDDTVEVTIAPAQRPAVGDLVRIFVEVPSIGEAEVARGRVTGVQAGRVTARLEGPGPRVAAGQTVRITAAAESGPATPPTPGDPAAASGQPPATAAVRRELASGLPVDLTSRLSGPTAEGRRIVAAVAEAMPRLHLSAHPVDDEIGRRTLENLLLALDGDKLFFSRQDAEGFRGRASDWDDALRRGDLGPAYDLYRLLLQRVSERARLAVELLAMDHDFAVDESLIVDRPRIDYPQDDLAARERWRKWTKYHLLTHLDSGADLDEARQRTVRFIADLLQRLHGATDVDLRDAVLDAFAAAYDPNSTYLTAAQFSDQQAQLAQQLAGVGAALKLIDGYVTVERVVPGGPAAEDGRLQPGDRILAVAEGADGPLEDVVGRRLADVVRLIRGAAGSMVRLRVLSPGSFEARVYALQRRRIDLSRLGATILTGEQLPARPEARVGYIYLPSFYTDLAARRRGETNYRSAARDLRPRLAEFKRQGVDVVLLDLRDNGGGSLDEAVDTTALFVGGADVVQSRDREGRIAQHANRNIERSWTGPVVVLTSRATGGAAEILAAAIQDYEHGLLLGDRSTSGAGTIGNLFDVGQVVAPADNLRLGYLRVTTARLYRPGGDSIQQRGVAPDVVLSSPTPAAGTGASSGPYALSADRVEALRRASFGYGADAELKQWLADRSQERRAASDYFQRLAAWRAERSRADADKTIHLKKSRFRAARAAQRFSGEPDAPRVPGVPRMALDAWLRESLAIALDFTSRTRYAAGERSYQARDLTAALEHYRSGVRTNPESRAAHYKVAWMLATCPDRKLRDGEAALAHARRAGEMAGWNGWHYRFVLALAEAEAGQFDRATASLDRALAAAPPDQRQRYGHLRERFAERRSF